MSIRSSRSIRTFGITLVCALASSTAGAQVVFDGTFGTTGTAPTRIFNTRLDYVIDESDGRRNGPNLFHSFSRFDIPLIESASFTATNPIDTIVARVTSGTPSFIDGRLRSEIPGADLFFINPAGVFFSKTAQIELPASFHIATADYLRFGDGVTFSSLDPSPSVTAAAPQAFGFMAGAAGDVLIAEPLPLRIVQGGTLSAVAGTVTVGTNGGTVLVPGGRIQFGGVGQAQVEVPVDLANWSTRNADASQLGAVRLVGDVTINALDNNNLTGSQGRLVIRGGRFESDFAFLSVGGEGAGEPAIDIEVAGDASIIDSNLESIALKAEGIRISSGTLFISTGRFLGPRVASFGSSDAGAIDIDTNQLTLDNGLINSNNSSFAGFPKGGGHGGDIRIQAQSVDLRAGSSIVTLTDVAGGSGNHAGNISISTETLTLDSNSAIFSRSTGTGDSGSIIIDSTSIDLAGNSSIATVTTGSAASGNDAGDVVVNSGSLSVRGGSQIFSRTEGTGDAGDVLIDVVGDLTLAGELVVPDPLAPTGIVVTPTGIFSRAGNAVAGNIPTAPGSAGLVRIRASSLSMTDGALISTRTFQTGNAGQIDIGTTGRLLIEGSGVQDPTRISTSGTIGDGGDITIAAGSLELRNGGEIRATTDETGNAGNVTAHAVDIALSGRSPLGRSSGIFAESTSTNPAQLSGSAGRLDLTATRDVILADGASILARSRGTGSTNSIAITAGDSIRLSSDATISSEAVSPTANVTGGDITLSAGNTVDLRSGATITAESLGLGDAGNIQITSGSLDAVDSSVTTNSANALGGNITLDSRGRVYLFRSLVTTDVRGGTGQGGDLIINAETATFNASTVTANAVGNATAGNIFINVTDGFLQSTNNILQATNEVGIQGQIVVQGPNAQAIGELSQLPANFLDASAQLEEACVARDTATGSFAIIRRGQFLLPPDAPLDRLDELNEQAESDSDSGGEMCEAPQ